MSSIIPYFRWAENADEIWLTIEVPAAKDASVNFEAGSFSFKSGDKALTLPLVKTIDPSASSYACKDREVEVRLVKAEDAKGWWNKLTPDAAKFKQQMKVDWELWADEDDDEEKAPDAGFGMGGMGGMGGDGNFDINALMAQMGGMGGMGGGMPGMDGGAGGMDFAKMMQQMGGAGAGAGMEGMDFGEDDAGAGAGDSDDEDVAGVEQ